MSRPSTTVDETSRYREVAAAVTAPLSETRVFHRPTTSPRKAAVPKASEASPPPHHDSTDYIRRNALDAIRARSLDLSAVDRAADRTPSPPRARHSAVPGSASRADFGRVPAYLQRRQAAWRAHEQEKARLAGEHGCPPGTRRMPKAKQTELLRALRRSEAELTSELLALPMAADTPKLLRRRTALEGRLGEVQAAVGVFSGPCVYEDVEPGARDATGSGRGARDAQAALLAIAAAEA